MQKVLIANRGEIAVRIARACRDAGLTSVAVYAEPDLDALHARVADEAYALGGSTATDSYLDIEKLLAVAARAGADAVHPGYGFLAENAAFARAVTGRGLTWIGPPASAIEALGDKVSARRIAASVGAPLVQGTEEPVADVAEVVAFARAHGLPIAIKAAFGGGGRGLKVARTEEEIPAMFDSAVREAVAAFGRGECFVERYLDRPRHVETQCLADTQGHVVVISTRDCSLQRRHQKLVEEAPAPFLDARQTTVLYSASKDILRAAGYVGAGTCEFLVGHDGTLSFLEVNTRLQVEHPVSEEVTGVDLVREQFRVADGEPLGYDDPEPRGHSIEFRINGEDPGRGFLPAPGRLTTWLPPSGPGVRVDSGVEAGSSVPQAFDSLLAKLIVTGADRTQALQRARRALAEFRIDGMPTALPFHRAVVDDPAFAPADARQPFSVHTRWIETEFVNRIPPYEPVGHAEGLPGRRAEGLPGRRAEGLPGREVHELPGREVVTVEVAGKRLEVSLPADLGQQRRPGAAGSSRPRRRDTSHAAGGHAGDELRAPMQGTIVKVAVENGQLVEVGDLVVVLEAMKMEQPLTAHRSGTVTGLHATPGEQMAGGAVICEIRSGHPVAADAD